MNSQVRTTNELIKLWEMLGEEYNANVIVGIQSLCLYIGMNLKLVNEVICFSKEKSFFSVDLSEFIKVYNIGLNIKTCNPLRIKSFLRKYE